MIRRGMMGLVLGLCFALVGCGDDDKGGPGAIDSDAPCGTAAKRAVAAGCNFCLIGTFDGCNVNQMGECSVHDEAWDSCIESKCEEGRDWARCVESCDSDRVKMLQCYKSVCGGECI